MLTQSRMRDDFVEKNLDPKIVDIRYKRHKVRIVSTINSVLKERNNLEKRGRGFGVPEL